MLGNALICGKDPQLLATRKLLLEKAGFRVIETNSADAIDDLVIEEPFDLVVLGQSMEELELSEAIRIVCLRWPLARILIMNVTGQPIVDAPNCEHLRSLDGPAALLSKAKEMVNVAREVNSPTV